MSISQLTIRNGAAVINEGHGGGIANGGNLTLYNLIIRDNTVYGGSGISQGGGVNNYGHLEINNCAIIDNYAEGSQNGGGGIGTSGIGTTIITNTTISGNITNGGGGGIFNTGSLTVRSSTVVENQAREGGGLFTTEASFWNSIVANNTANTYNNCRIYVSIASIGYNLDSENSCQFDSTGDQVNTNPLIGPLQDNGGSTLTHALLTGSPAIDSGERMFFPATDQRGVPRPQGLYCDIGAFEYYLLVPSLTINYDTGAPGSYFLITGGNFPVDESATLIINDHIISDDIAVDSEGSLIFRLSTGQAEEGAYFVTVSVNPSASVSFRLDHDAPLREIAGEGDIIEVPAGIAYQLILLPMVSK